MTTNRPPAPTATRRGRTALATAGAVAALGLLPATAHAHGGELIARGEARGVDVVVQGSERTDGVAGLHVAATVTGEAAPDPEAVRVRFAVRDGAEDAVRTKAGTSDGGPVHDVDIARGDRRPWKQWDITALVTLGDGRTVRVTNAPEDPPAAAAADEPGGEATAQPRDGAPSAAAAPVDATSATAEQGAPGWVLPSGVAIVLVAAVAVLLARRRRTE